VIVLERLADLEKEYDEISARLADPAVIADPRRYADTARRYKELEEIVLRSRRLAEARADLEAARELHADAVGADRDGWKAEMDASEATIASLEDELRLLLVPRDPNDGKNVILEIRGTAGGEEANLFARDLYDMYDRFAQRAGWKIELLEAQPSDLGGFQSVTFVVKGDDAWARLKHEGGPHRVQRVPVTESQGRVHTSAATVTVLPEADEVEVDIDPNDLQVDVYRSSGPGGQSVNTTDSAVRITHKPTGLVVSMQDQKSQLQNKAKALQVLRARLLQREQDRQRVELSDARRGQTGTGDRSEKIRTYNVKENRVTDHRIGLTIYRLDKVLQGDLDDVVDALVADERSRQLQLDA
jgi:peptide chain release factor 1